MIRPTVYYPSTDTPGDDAARLTPPLLPGDPMLPQSQPRPLSHAHQHMNIQPNFTPTLTALHRYLKDGGWLEMDRDHERIKFARAGHFVYVPRSGAANYASSMRMALLQTALADDLTIRLELPDTLRR